MADVNGVLREFTKSKEMAFAWIFRGTLGLLMTLLCAIAWMAWDKLDTVSKQGVSSATEFSKLNVTVQAGFARYDTLKVERDREVDQITTQLGDHETRIRALEKH